MSPLLAKIALVGVLLLAVWESGRALQLSSQRVGPGEVQAMITALEAEPGPVLAHRPWLEPQVRGWLREHSALSATGFPDTWPEFWTLGHRSDPPSLDLDLPAELEHTVAQGSLVARRWRVQKPRAQLAVLGPGPSLPLTARVEAGSCRVSKDAPLEIRCPDQSTLQWEEAEIDYQGKHCLAFRSYTLGSMVLQVQLPSPRGAGRLVGHVGFSDFNARLRSDAALQLRISSGEQVLINQPFSDAQGWAPFQSEAIPAPESSTLPIRIELQLNGHRAASETLRRQVIPCLELRWLQVQDAEAM